MVRVVIKVSDGSILNYLYKQIMQVLNYHTAPIASETIDPSNAIDQLGKLQQQINQPFIQTINNTFETINQTINTLVNQTFHQTANKLHDQKTIQTLSHTQHFQDQWNFLYFIRLFFYLVVILKIIELVFSKRKKMDIRERVYRKYVFSHSEMIREFNQDDRKVMDLTLKNTIKNASIEKTHLKMTKKSSNKKVIFFQNKNQYFQPPKITENQKQLSPLQIFLSRPVKIQPMQKEPQQEPEQRQFQIIETINQSTQVDDESGIFFQHSKEESSITQSTNANSVLQPEISQIQHQTQIIQQYEVNA